MKQATIEHLAHRIREGRAFLDQFSQNKVITEKELNIIVEDPKVKADIDKVLGMLEHDAVGLNTGVYDKEIFFRMFGNSLTLIFNKMKPYIEWRREREMEYLAYVELEQIANEYKEGIRIRNGRIK